MDIYFNILVVLYVGYVFIESLGVLARYAGYSVGALPIGLSVQTQILSLNRFLGFAIAPMVGFYVDSGGTESSVLLLGFIGVISGGLGLIFVYFNWKGVSSFFRGLVCSIKNRGYSLNSIIRARKFPERNVPEYLLSMKWNYLFAQFITTGFAMPAVFVLNILAIRYFEYSATLLQMSTVISGLGNLVLNFYTIPLLAVEESRKNKEVNNIYRSIFMGKILGMVVLAPIILLAGVSI